MPLVRIAMRQGKSAQYRRAIADGVHANDIVMIQIVLNQRAMNVKLALYKAITEWRLKIGRSVMARHST